jgi:hypothetical protein
MGIEEETKEEGTSTNIMKSSDLPSSLALGTCDLSMRVQASPQSIPFPMSECPKDGWRLLVAYWKRETCHSTTSFHKGTALQNNETSFSCS